MEDKYSIGIVFVNYNSETSILQCLNDSILGSTNTICVIVENSSSYSDEIKKLIVENAQQKIIYIKNDCNNGYLNGLAFGIKYIIKYYSEINWIVCANSDIVCNFTEVKNALLETNHEKIGIWGPYIRDEKSGLNQNPFLSTRPQKKKIFIWKLIFSNYYLFIFYNILSKIKLKYKNIRNNSKSQVYSVHGSFFAISKIFALKNNYLSWNSFLFGEEIYLAELAIRTNMKVIYEPKIIITHKQHITTSLLKLKYKRRLHLNSLKYILDKFWSN